MVVEGKSVDGWRRAEDAELVVSMAVPKREGSCGSALLEEAGLVESLLSSWRGELA